VKLQIQIAPGAPLPFRQGDLEQRGHAIECRVYAEDPDQGFLPSPGRIKALRLPGGPGVRDDSGVYEGYEVPIHYDPLISKLACHGRDRGDAIGRLRRAVSEYTILGIKTTLPFFSRVLRHPSFVAGEYDTSFVEKFFQERHDPRERPWDIAVAAAAIRVLQDRRAARHDPGADGRGSSGWRQAAWRELGSRRP